MRYWEPKGEFTLRVDESMFKDRRLTEPGYVTVSKIPGSTHAGRAAIRDQILKDHLDVVAPEWRGLYTVIWANREVYHTAQVKDCADAADAVWKVKADRGDGKRALFKGRDRFTLIAVYPGWPENLEEQAGDGL